MESPKGEEHEWMQTATSKLYSLEKQQFKEQFQGLPQIKDFYLLTVWEESARDADGNNWDIVAMVLGFGISTYINQTFQVKSLVEIRNSRL